MTWSKSCRTQLQLHTRPAVEQKASTILLQHKYVYKTRAFFLCALYKTTIRWQVGNMELAFTVQIHLLNPWGDMSEKPTILIDYYINANSSRSRERGVRTQHSLVEWSWRFLILGVRSPSFCLSNFATRQKKVEPRRGSTFFFYTQTTLTTEIIINLATFMDENR